MPLSGMGGVTLSHVCFHCNCFILDDYICWLSSGHDDGNNRKKKQRSWWCAACGGQFDWRAPNRILVVQLGTNTNEAKVVFRAHAASQLLCDNLINALKLWRISRKMAVARFKALLRVCTREVEEASWMG